MKKTTFFGKLDWLQATKIWIMLVASCILIMQLTSLFNLAFSAIISTTSEILRIKGDLISVNTSAYSLLSLPFIIVAQIFSIRLVFNNHLQKEHRKEREKRTVKFNVNDSVYVTTGVYAGLGGTVVSIKETESGVYLILQRDENGSSIELSQDEIELTK